MNRRLDASASAMRSDRFVPRLFTRSRGRLLWVGLLMVLVTACTPQDTRFLPALLEDPIAHLELEGAELVRRSESPYESGGLFGGSPAHVSQQFRVDSGMDEQVLIAAKESAESVGWTFDDQSEFGSWQGTKTVAEGRMGVHIAYGTHMESQPLLINLSFTRRCSVDWCVVEDG